MKETRIKISSIIENQFPKFVIEEFPLVLEFFTQYYISLEKQGGATDLLQNIDQYIKLDNLTNLVDSTTLTDDITFVDTTIKVESTEGFPDVYGLILIDSEIITYNSKTESTFEGCTRGFSGVTSYQNSTGELTFTESQALDHLATVDGVKTEVKNLSTLFLKEFLYKTKKQISPGFENRSLFSGVNENLFIKQSSDFYSSKGTDNSFKILFKALYGENVDIIKPRDYLIKPSDAEYRITLDLVVESILSDPELLVNNTLFQDDDGFLSSAQGTVTNVQRIQKDEKDYYLISLDYDYDKDIRPVGTVLGDFTIHPKTKTISNVSLNSTIIDVDSTIGFPKSGRLLANLDNGSTLNIIYTDKSFNQFLNCSGIDQFISENTELKYDSYAYANFNNTEIRVRILGILNDYNIPNNSALYQNGHPIVIKSIGKEATNIKSNRWFFNIPTKYEVTSFVLSNNSDGLYKIFTKNNHIFKNGDEILLISSSSDQYLGYIVSYNDEKSFTVQLGSNVRLNESLNYEVKRSVNRPSFENYPELSRFLADVQNTYYDETDNSVYVTTSSLPAYSQLSLKTNDLAFTLNENKLFNGEVLEIGNHNFYTGDSVVYKQNSLGISTGVYYVNRVNDTQIQLAKSRNDIFNQKFISVNGFVSKNTKLFERTDFVGSNFTTKLLNSQHLIRKISTPEETSQVQDTHPGTIGIFVNGVELLNYKSLDNVYYGPIEEVVPTANGRDYDVINPPVLEISDSVGYGATGYCSVIGKLEKINIINPGFDYIEEPRIIIRGGNGKNASAKANLITFDHVSTFNSQESAKQVKLGPINTITFADHHKFRNHEEVIYIPENQTSVGGLSANSSYFVSVQNEYDIKLHKSFSDAVSGINTISLTSYGTGVHTIKSKLKKKKIGSITIENSGENYQNRFTTTSPIGINTSLSVIKIKNHGYNSGEIITYNSTGSSIGGLTTSTSYYITKIDEDQFKLSKVGISTLGESESFYYNSKQYINFTNTGQGTHQFNYPKIEVLVEGRIGINTFTNQDLTAKLQPIFRGEIQSVFLESGGTNYGSEGIINHNRQPFFNLNSGKNAKLIPIVSNGEIVEVLIGNSGSGYNAPPTIDVIGSGIGAILTPIIENGSIKEVKIIYGGIGYDSKNTSIVVTSSGSGAKFEAIIKSWRFDLVNKLIENSQILEDDGIIIDGINSDVSLQFVHGYSPRYLRSIAQGTRTKDGKTFYSNDLILTDNTEQDSISHSPILGWAYDGNPIYGPYGYSEKNGGRIKSLTSSYVRSKNLHRPSESIYPLGSFVEDYTFDGSGDLDEHNGRFCVTPEFPEGTYAYFSTITNRVINSEGSIFYKFKKPVFPYVIGNTFKSSPITFNFNKKSNQDNFDPNQTNLIRNITPYNILNNKNSYPFLLNTGIDSIQNSYVKSVSFGKIDSFDIADGGSNYKIGDELIFNSEFKTDLDKSAKARVSLISGKEINKISVATSTTENVTLLLNQNKVVGFCTLPHNYLSGDLVTFTGSYDYKKVTQINVPKNNLILTTGIGSITQTGIVTYFNVSGNLNYPNVAENDIYDIENEQIQVLNVDSESSRIRVIRNLNNVSAATSHSIGVALTEKSRKIELNLGISTVYSYKPEYEYYFDPKESVGIGTTSGVGISSVIYFANPGVGITQLAIPTQTIYLKNHNFTTGESLIYSSNGGNSIAVSTDGAASFSLQENSTIYAVKISNDLIGISTFRISIGSSGDYVSSGSTITNILYFTGVGLGNTHSFKSIVDSSLKGRLDKNTVTVLTKENHNLSASDEVSVNVISGITTTIKIQYDDGNRRLIVNPKQFTTIDLSNNNILIENHSYYTGQKIVYNSSSTIGGLENGKIYYVIVISKNEIRLANSYYDAIRSNPISINITTSGSGIISEINPPLKALKNQSLIFDLSDSSLSFISNAISDSAFNFKFFSDLNFKDEFNTFDVIYQGRIGIDTNAKVILNAKDTFPEKLYYNLIPINNELNSQIKREIVVDDEVANSNSISFVNSVYEGTYNIIGIGSTNFSYIITETPEVKEYLAGVEYNTTSKTANGKIENIKIIDGGNYRALPFVSEIKSQQGKNALIYPKSESIGKVQSIETRNIDFDYSADFTLRPISKLPEILSLEPLNTIDHIRITFIGTNYNTPPNLILINQETNEVNSDVILEYIKGNSFVKIIKNSKTIRGTNQKIVPVNNSNGIEIKNITFNNSTKDVTITLKPVFNDESEIPFSVGDKIFVEGVSVGIETTGKGYNSSNYNYATFTLTSVSPTLANATITYNLSSFLDAGENPGSYNLFYSYGKIVPESYFPQFDIQLKENDFIKDENVFSDSASGKVVFWDKKNYLLSVSTNRDFKVGELITGRTSNSLGIIKKITQNDSSYQVKATTEIKKNWNRETGFLNNDLQRIHDNDYYQYFSYDLRSRVDIGTWGDPVSVLNHTAGFKKFGNLIVESPANSGIATEQNKGDFTRFVDISSVIDLDCINDYDLVRENNLVIDGTLGSNEIYFNSKIVQDYVESIGNRVLLIDNLSTQFNSNPRATRFATVDSFILDDYDAIKYITLVQDKFFNELQINHVSLIHNENTGFINQYKIYSDTDLGFFDFSVFGNRGNLVFYPTKYEFNDYYVSNFSFSLKKTLVGLSTVNLGDSIKIHTNNVYVPQGTTSAVTIVGIASTYRSSKILVQIGSSESTYSEYDEISYIHNDSDVITLNYGSLSNKTTNSLYSVGIGTYNIYLSGQNVIVDLIPNNSTTINYTIKTICVSIANTSLTGIGTENIGKSIADSSNTFIASSSSPTSTIISRYPNTDYKASYSIISIENLTDSEYQLSELMTISDNPGSFGSSSEKSYYSEYGIIQSDSHIGIITTGIIGSETLTYFTPKENIDVNVKVFEVTVGTDSVSDDIPLVNGELKYSYDDYIGTSNDVRKQFNLTHKNVPIFQKYFDGSSSNIVKIDNNLLKIPNHFYSTGEEIVYTQPGSGTTQAIGIATTTITGIGLTDKLPNTVYVVKIDDINIRVAASASDALKTVPNVLKIASVGIGSSHLFTSKKQNSRSLITLDNVIQNPILSFGSTTHLVSNVSKIDVEIFVNDSTTIFGGSLIKINDEIMRVNSVGVGSTNSLLVTRRLLGSGISSHLSNDVITSVYGNYNIVDNTIYFAEAPYGQVPITNFSNRPDEVDYIGISTSSSFSGRVFLRSGIPNGTSDAYSKNYVIDDISSQFNGITTTFTLKSNSSNITGIASDNSIILINNIFQSPNSNQETNEYVLQENSGITSVTFLGNQKTNDYDINVASVPRGGIIISVGSTQGFGYQPLVAAGGTAIVSAAGTIQSISIGNSGSGYRSGIQTKINVGIKTSDLIGSNIDFIGIASVMNGNVIGVAITNPGIGYTNYSISKITSVSQNISIGSTVILLNDASNIFVGNYISVGLAVTNALITGIGSTSITIGLGNTASTIISSGTTAVIKYYNPPNVIFDSPLSYSNIPLVYSNQSTLGVGTGAVVDIIVGLGSSVINFELKNLGHGYKKNELLTIGIGGTVGIPTLTTSSFSEFQINVDEIDYDRFSAWSIGKLQILDSIETLFDGKRTVFPITVDTNRISIKSKPGSNVEVKAALLVFLNDVLQVPDEGYIFNGGSIIQFTEAPKPEDTCKIVFYRGTDNVDTLDTDILENIKIGDEVKINSDSFALRQSERVVNEIISSDSIKTNLYSENGVSEDENLLRPLIWCKQRNDLVINGIYVGKDRPVYEPYIHPSANIIQSVGTASTIIFVENVRPFFNSKKEYLETQNQQNKIIIISQESTSPAFGTAIVSIAGTISSISITDGGIGYSTSPIISIGNPIGVGSSGKANGIVNILSGSVASVSLTTGGFGYSQQNPPSVMFEYPTTKTEIISDVSYEGDFGIITGISTTTVGVASTGIIFDLFIPPNSILRDTSLVKVGIATTGISGIQTNYYFTVSRSNVGNGVTSLNNSGQIIGIGTVQLDNVYQAVAVSIGQSSVPGIGVTYVTKVTVSVSDYNGLIGLGYSSYYGDYSWGAIFVPSRQDPMEFITTSTNSPIVRRFNRLKYLNYNT